MARVELPQSKIKARKRRMRRRITAVAAVVFGVLLGGSIAFFHAPFLRVTTVAVSGAQTIAVGDVQQFVEQHIADNYLFVYPKDDIFLYPQTSIEAELLKQYPTLKSVDVHADNFHTIGVVLHERTPAALWCGIGPAPGPCRLMDEDGVAYVSAATASTTYVMYMGAVSSVSVSDPAPQYLSREQFHALMSLVDALSQVEQSDKVAQVAIDANGDAFASFQSGFVLKFSTSDETGDVFERFTLALKADPLAGKTLRSIEYVDLRFGDKLYYKLKTQ